MNSCAGKHSIKSNISPNQNAGRMTTANSAGRPSPRIVKVQRMLDLLRQTDTIGSAMRVLSNLRKRLTFNWGLIPTERTGDGPVSDGRHRTVPCLCAYKRCKCSQNTERPWLPRGGSCRRSRLRENAVPIPCTNQNWCKAGSNLSPISLSLRLRRSQLPPGGSQRGLLRLDSGRNNCIWLF